MSTTKRNRGEKYPNLIAVRLPDSTFEGLKAISEKTGLTIRQTIRVLLGDVTKPAQSWPKENPGNVAGEEQPDKKKLPRAGKAQGKHSSQKESTNV